MRVSKAILFLMLGVLLFGGITGCSDDDDGPVGPVGTNSTARDASGNYWVTRLDATSDDEYTYYSFATKDIVTTAKPAANAANEWDLGFQRSVVVTNSGNSGSGDVLGVNFTQINSSKDFVAVTQADADGVAGEAWVGDGQNLVLEDYYTYNFQTHVATMTQTVYALLDAEGKYVKVQFLDFVGGAAPPAMSNFVIKYVYQGTSGSTDLTAPVQIDTVDGSTGLFYYDFSSGQVVSPADPANSLEWDIKVENYNAYLNSSFSGPGQAGANPASALVDGMTDATDFNFYTSAITVPQAYAQDEQGSIFTNWYNYDGQTHTLSSRGDIYLVQSDGKTYKVKIETYYGDTGQSGNYIWYWEEL